MLAAAGPAEPEHVRHQPSDEPCPGPAQPPDTRLRHVLSGSASVPTDGDFRDDMDGLGPGPIRLAPDTAQEAEEEFNEGVDSDESRCEHSEDKVCDGDDQKVEL